MYMQDSDLAYAKARTRCVGDRFREFNFTLAHDCKVMSYGRLK